MTRKINLGASVGRQRITKLTPGNEAHYVAGIREAMRAVISGYERLISELNDVSADVVYDALLPTFKLSQNYCPKDTHRLVNSGFLEIVTRGKTPRVAIGYAKRGDPHYAVFVHELTHLNHKAPTRAKFLLAALEHDQHNIQQRLVRGYKKTIGLT